MGTITSLDYARVRHKPTGVEGLVVPEWFGWRCCSWNRVNVMIENSHHPVVQMLLVEELEVLERVDPETIDESKFSLVLSKNRRRKKKT